MIAYMALKLYIKRKNKKRGNIKLKKGNDRIYDSSCSTIKLKICTFFAPGGGGGGVYKGMVYQYISYKFVQI